MSDTCVYCGEHADTRDHVPPKCLFKPPLPGNMITVPACLKCNRGFQPHEELVRNVLTGLADTEHHPAVLQHLEGKRNRSLARSRPALDGMMGLITDVGVATPDGIILGRAKGFDLDKPCFDQFFNRVCRGLIHDVLGETDCIDLVTDWRIVGDQNELKKRTNASTFPFFHRSIGSEFEFVGIGVQPNWPSIWIMRFYQGPIFMAHAKPV